MNTQWQIDLLQELLGEITHGPLPGTSELLSVRDANIWYDQDYYRLSFSARGHQVKVRLYKVFAAEIDGKEHWIGCPTNQLSRFSLSLRKDFFAVNLQPKISKCQKAPRKTI